MKKVFILILTVVFATFFNQDVKAQFFVKIRPTIVINANTRPLAPSRNHIWIEPEYAWRNGNYVLVQGYWAEPRMGYRYAPGYWKFKKRRGHCWVPGRWVR